MSLADTGMMLSLNMIDNFQNFEIERQLVFCVFEIQFGSLMQYSSRSWILSKDRKTQQSLRENLKNIHLDLHVLKMQR